MNRSNYTNSLFGGNVSKIFERKQYLLAKLKIFIKVIFVIYIMEYKKYIDIV